jgi:CubicO group peptidase (beta-lactamase class C family)
MRRLLVIFVLIGLVMVSLAVAVIASDWPFWQRAWVWQHAVASGPEHIPGSWRGIGRGAGATWPVASAGPTEQALQAQLAALPGTQAVLAERDGRLLVEHYAPGTAADTLLQGDALTTALLAPLYGVARQAGTNLLDVPLRQVIPDWEMDARGDITPRQLLWQTSGLESPPFRALNPFSARARLASGPNFQRAALAFRAAFPPGSHFETSPVNAQLLAIALENVRGQPLATLLETGLWTPLGAGRAQVALDRLGGDMAAHCCFAATARDWLRLARLLAEDGTVGPVRLLPPGFVAEMARETPVHPGYGLGFEVETLASPETLLWATAPGRLMLVAPAHRSAAVWFGPTASAPAARAQLKAALGLEQAEPEGERQP